MEKFTFLTAEQIWGDNKIEQLDIFKKYGTKCAITDFAILLGGYVSNNEHTSEGNSLADRTGWWWSASKRDSASVRVADAGGYKTWSRTNERSGAARPASLFSTISQIIPNRVRGYNGIQELEYDEYPQMAVMPDIAEKLERLYSNGSIKKTDKTYTTDSRKYDDYDSGFQAKSHIEYEYNSKKFVRVEANSCFGSSEFILSTGKKYQNKDNVWVEVQPIKWLVDERKGIIVAKKALFAGVQFNLSNSYDGNFERTDMKKFLDNCFTEDIIADRDRVFNQQESTVVEHARKKNPYNFTFTDVSEEDIIKGSIESGIAVFLHGPSSEGKSARVKQLDPDCEIIYLRNATPESLNGKSVYNAGTGEMIDIPPTWFKKVSERCKNEPNKIHIVFFDEITNALHSIQGTAFNIVLDREVNGLWKLPDNCRVVAAGNDMNDSLAANQLVEPLFNRFAHTYIKTSVNDWLKWASTVDKEHERIDYDKAKPEHKIHPSIYAFIAYRGEEALKSKYIGERPNADPRKWEMASKLLYKTKNPEMLRALVGDDITRDFCQFCNQQVITLQDVVDDKYSEADFDMNTSEKYATTVGLSFVDDKNIDKVRKFITRIGKEFAAVFDSLWAHGNEIRMEKIAELRTNRIEHDQEGGKRL